MAQLAPLAWRPVAGSAQDIAVGGKGEVAAVDPAGLAFRRDVRTGGWQPVGRGMARVAFDASGKLWGIDQQGVLRQFSGTEWRAFGQGAADLAAAPDGAIVVANDAGGLARYDPATSTWQPIPGSARRVAVDARGLVWAVAGDGGIARRLGDIWVGIGGRARDIAADGGGRVVIAGTDGKVYEWTEDLARWDEVAGAADAVAIAIGSGQLWRADSDGKLHAKGVKAISDANQKERGDRTARKGSKEPSRLPDSSPIEFTKVASGLSRLAIGADGSVFGLTATGALRRWSNVERRFNEFPGSLGQLGVDSTGLPFGLGTGGSFVRHDGEAWRMVTLRFGLIDLAITGEENGLAINTEGQLFRLGLKDEGVTYQRLGGDAFQVALAADGSYWYRNPAGLVFQCDPSANCRRQAVRATDIAIGPGGTVFLVDDQANLRRFDAATGLFDMLRRASTLRVAVGPGDRPWIIEKNGDILAAKLFERDESQDALLGKKTESTASVTKADPPASTTPITVFGQTYRFTAVDIPSSAPGYPSLSTYFRDVTVGHDDQIIVTGYDDAANPCTAQTTGWKGSNWIYSPTKKQFVHLAYLKQVAYQLAIATRNLTTVGWGTSSAAPALADAPAVPAIYASLRGCERYYTVQYSTTIFAGDPMLYSEGGLGLLQSILTTSSLTANSRDITLTVDHDITLDDWLVEIFPERKINFLRIGAGYSVSAPIERRTDYKFARIGVGATRNVLWATDVDSNVYEYVPATDRFEQRSILADDRAQDVGVGKDGSVFIVDLAGRLKKWNPALKGFSSTGKTGVTRVAVTSKGMPVVANFPASPRVYIAQ